MQKVAEDGGGQLYFDGTKLRFRITGYQPDLARTETVKNLRAIIHGRYSLANGRPMNAEIDPTKLQSLPYEIKEEMKALKKQQMKTEGKRDRQRKNYQKDRAGRKALLFK